MEGDDEALDPDKDRGSSNPEKVKISEPQRNSDESHLRQYRSSNTGPYTVFIRELQHKISPVQFAIHINKHYKSVCLCRLNNDKMKVILADMQEANALVSDSVFAEYRVYIPSAQVEVDGAINYSDLFDLCDLNDLKKYGEGKFNNTMLSPVKILSVQRLPKRSETETETVELTNTVKVTFVGRILPDYIVIESLRIRVRAFFNKPMFCSRCQQFNHTNKFCKRKPKCARCHEQHLTTDCNNTQVDRSRCPYCDSKHATGTQDCPHFAEVQECYKQRQISRLRERYVNAVSSLVVQNDHDGDYPALANQFDTFQNDDENPQLPSTSFRKIHNRPAPVNPWSNNRNTTVDPTSAAKGVKRKRDGVAAPSASYSSILKTPATSFKSANPSPPGFQSSKSSPIADNTIKDVIMNHIRSSNIPKSWLSVIEVILPIILDAILPNMSTLLSAVLPALLTCRS